MDHHSSLPGKKFIYLLYYSDDESFGLALFYLWKGKMRKKMIRSRFANIDLLIFAYVILGKITL